MYLIMIFEYIYMMKGYYAHKIAIRSCTYQTVYNGMSE